MERHTKDCDKTNLFCNSDGTEEKHQMSHEAQQLWMTTYSAPLEHFINET